jgi:hypothetical protein
MADYALFVIGSAVTPVTAYRVNLAFYHMHREEIAAMYQLPVGPVAMLDRRPDLHFIGMAVGAERTFMAESAQPVVTPRIEAVVLDEGRRMAEGPIRFEYTLDCPLVIVFVAFGAVNPPFAQGLRMGGG